MDQKDILEVVDAKLYSDITFSHPFCKTKDGLVWILESFDEDGIYLISRNQWVSDKGGYDANHTKTTKRPLTDIGVTNMDLEVVESAILHSIHQTTPRLVQRLKIKQSPNSGTKLRFSEVVETEYMGAAEFEFGAIPEAYRKIASNLPFFKLLFFMDFLNEEGKPLYVFTCFEGKDLDTYIGYLKKMRDGKIRLQEGSRFEKGASKYSKIDLWWDIENQVIWSFDAKFMKYVSFYLANSARYIAKLDEQE